MQKLGRSFSVLALVMALVISFLPAQTQQAFAASADVVISQVYGGGGNSGATLKNDFVELFNRGAAAVDISSWSIQYASASGSSWQVTNLVGTIQPGQYYLVQEAAGSGGTVNLPTPDAVGTIPMSGTNGKVALVNYPNSFKRYLPIYCGFCWLWVSKLFRRNCSGISVIQQYG